MKQWLYKRDEKPKIFEDDAIQTALNDGWVDSPAKIKTTYEDYTLDDLKTYAIKRKIPFASNITKPTLIEKFRAEDNIKG